jgi:phage terminase large subunit GpA-like protein
MASVAPVVLREILGMSSKGKDMTKTAQKPFALVDRMDLSLLCPHCDEEIAEVYRKGTGFPLAQGRTLVYFCPHCLKVLGFAQGRVF